MKANRKHKANLWLLPTLALLLWGTLLSAAPFSTDGITIEVPAGFEGPITQNNSGAKMFAYAKQSVLPSVRTLLQITVLEFDSGVPPDKMTSAMLSQGSEKYLLDFLQGVERRRTDFIQGKVDHLLIDAKQASKASWQGSAQGVVANGVMYCVMLTSKIVLFHTQDAGGEPTANMKEAMKAIEGVKLK